MNVILLSFAFVAGLQAFFAPCSVALIPAYIGYYVGREQKKASYLQELFFGFKAGIFASLGLMSVYLVFGLSIALLGKVIAPFISWIELATGGILLFLGVATLLGYKFAIKPPTIITSSTGGVYKKFYLFGVTYAFGAIGCTLPIFLLVIFQSLAQGGFVGGLVNFSAYALAMTLLMIVFSMIAAISKTAMSRFLQRYMPVIQKSAGMLIIFAGIYLVYLALKVIII